MLLRSGGYEPESEGMTQRMKMLLLSRFIPMVESNFNMAELGPRSSGKSYVFKELSPYSYAGFWRDKVQATSLL